MRAPSLPRPLTPVLFALLVFAAPARATRCTIEPASPVAGHPVTVIYDKSGGPLAASANIRLHRGINGWSPVASPDPQLTPDPGRGPAIYTWTFTTPESAYQLDFAFNGVELSTVWDNNGGQDWHFDVTPAPAPEPVPAPPPLPPEASRAGVMMQGFYWDVPAGGTWYDVLAAKAASLRDMRGGHGIDRIWFPPPSKGDSGRFSMGYDPYDYYDLGNYAQKGTIAGRFGTQAQLKAAIAAYHGVGIEVLADVVLNHRGGGAAEANPNTGTITYTDFSQVASGRATWRHDQFHPSPYEHSDDMAFGGYPDVCLAANTPDVVGFPRRDLLDWLGWLQDPANAGFNGWRLDLAQGYRPSFVAELRRATGHAFAVMEKWDGNTRNLEAQVIAAGGTPAFDFAAYYTLRDICLNPASADLADLLDPGKMFVARNPAMAVTFCENHDTDKEPTQYLQNKMLAYAFILTWEGYPCLFWKDYFDHGLATLGGQPGNGIDALVWARGALAEGRPRIETLDRGTRELLVYGTTAGTRRAPGYLVALNIHASEARSAAVTTTNLALRGKTLRCYAWYSHAPGANMQPADITCGPEGEATVMAPPLGYAVYGPADLRGSPPAITRQPASATVAAGSPATFDVGATGLALAYQWYCDGIAVAGATGPALTLARAQAFHAGAYTVSVSDGVDTIVSAPAVLTVEPPPPSAARLLNISTRGFCGTGDAVLIPGFVLSGSQSRRLLLRAVGPSLARFGVPAPLANPAMRVQRWNSALRGGGGDWEPYAGNDDWTSNANQAELAAVAAEVGAFTLGDPSLDAALLLDVMPGRYTVVADGVAGATGVAIVEAYDAGPQESPARLINISTRGFVGVGSAVMIPGFVVSPEGPRTFLIRAVGPTLARYGVAETLADPVLELYEKVAGPPPMDLRILEIDDWGDLPDSATTATVAATVGAFSLPAGSSDAACVVTLPPGLYTAIVRGQGTSSGVALAEVYLVP